MTPETPEDSAPPGEEPTSWRTLAYWRTSSHWRTLGSRIGRHPLGRIGFLAVVGAALGLVWPVPSPASGVGSVPEGAARPPSGRHEADLERLLATARWGAPPLETPSADDGDPQDGLNPELVKLGYIGISAAGDDVAVLLRAADGAITRYLPGDALPDGRILAAVTDNAVTLAPAGAGEDTGVELEVLVLFPRLGGTETATTTVDYAP